MTRPLVARPRRGLASSRTGGRVALVLAALVAVAGGARPARAQCTTNTTTCRVATLAGSAALTVPRLTSLTVSGSALTLAASRLGAADYDAGGVDGGSLVVTATANAAWTVTFAPTTATFGYAGAFANPAKPASELRWARAASCPAAGASYVATAPAGNAVFASGTATATPQGGLAQRLCFRTALDWARDVPGTYTLGLTITISAP